MKSLEEDVQSYNRDAIFTCKLFERQLEYRIARTEQMSDVKVEISIFKLWLSTCQEKMFNESPNDPPVQRCEKVLFTEFLSCVIEFFNWAKLLGINVKRNDWTIEEKHFRLERAMIELSDNIECKVSQPPEDVWSIVEFEIEPFIYLSNPTKEIVPGQVTVIKSFLTTERIRNLEIEIPLEKICFEESEDDRSSDICFFINKQDIETFGSARRILNQIIWDDLK
jgi:hypothetical protein